MDQLVKKKSNETHAALCRKPKSKHEDYDDCAYCRWQAERLTALYGPVRR